MSDDELRAVIAAALGWKRYEAPALAPPWFWAAGEVEVLDDGCYVRKFNGAQTYYTLPDWLHSLDACARDLLPVARERGWNWLICNDDASPGHYALFKQSGGDVADMYADTPARALCMAWLAGPGKAVAG